MIRSGSWVRTAAVLLLWVLALLQPPLPAAAQEEGEGQEAGSAETSAGEEKLVCLYPLQVRESGAVRETLRALSSSILDTLELSLHLLEGYQVRVLQSRGPTEEAGLRRAADELGAEHIIFGALQREGRGVRARLRVYDRRSDRVAEGAEAKAESLLETVDLADRVIVELLQRYSGRRVGFGSLRLEPEGSGDPYRVRIAGIDAGEDLRGLEKVLTGEYRLTIVQDRGDGERVLADRRVTIREGERTTVRFTLPYLTEEESDFFRARDRLIVNGWARKEQERIPQAFTRAIERSSAGEKAGIEGLADLHTKYLSWRRAYHYYLQEAPPADRSLVPQPLGAAEPFPYAGLSPALLPAPMRGGGETAEETGGAGRAGELLSLAAAGASVDAMLLWKRGHRLPNRNITVGGLFRDWEDEALISDERLDSRRYGADIAEVYCSASRESLYGGLRIGLGGPEETILYRMMLRGRYGTVELRIRRQEEGAAEMWSAKGTCRTEGGSRKISWIRLVPGKEGFEFALPLEEITGCIGGGPIRITAAAVDSGGGEILDRAGPTAVYIPSARRYDPALGLAERGRDYWRASMRLGFYTDPRGEPVLLTTAGAYYRLGPSLHLGADAYFFPDKSFEGPRAIGVPVMVYQRREERPTHIFSLLPLPGRMTGDKGSFFILGGYGISYRGAVLHALVGTDLTDVTEQWIGAFIGAGVLF